MGLDDRGLRAPRRGGFRGPWTMKPAFSVVPGSFTIHRLDPAETIPASVAENPFCWIARTDEELSIACRSTLAIDSDNQVTGWSCLRAQGPLDFESTGILAGITDVLAAAEISVFAISTFDTDYVLVKADALPAAVAALREAGYPIG